MIRCGWSKGEQYNIYHDEEWGVPVHDDQKLFEFITLESAQAGLSWATILQKRENYRKAYDHFDPVKVAKYDEKKVGKLVEDAGIVRNKMKIEASIANAKVFLDIQKEFKSFDNYIWKFTDGKVVQNHFKSLSEIPAKTELSTEISQDLKKRGLKFFGPVTCYAFLQAVGIVNDHVTTCFKYETKARPKKLKTEHTK